MDGPMSGVLQRLVAAVLGHQEIATSLPRSLDGASGFVPIEANRQGYLIQRYGEEITIRRVDPWANVIGLPALYHFHGELRREADGPVVRGRILMSKPAQWFILTWVGTILVALLGGLVWGAVLASDFVLSPAATLGGDLAAVGLLLGGIFTLGLFGALIISLVRVISRRQKRKLLVFLKSPELT